MQRIFSTLMLSLLATVITAPLAVAQAAPQTQTANQTNPFKTEELEQLVAPIALYPDALMAQVLMASTYPLEVVSAARWSKANPNVKDKDLDRAMQQQPWDASVKSLTAFPQVLQMMNDKLDWTQKIGDAFLAQQGDVMDAAQRLRARAQAEGNLKSSKEQIVRVEPSTTSSSTVIIIEPATPQTVYVPVYNPVYVYGAWPYPYYTPYYWYPPYYAYPGNVFSFGLGVMVGAAIWGGFDWHHHDVNININNFNRYNHTNISNGNWKHNADHRRGVQYRDAATQQKFNKGTRPGVENREAFRGRADSARKELNGMDKSQVREQIQNLDREQVGDKLQNVDREQASEKLKNVDRSKVNDKLNKVDKDQLRDKAQKVDRSKVQQRTQQVDRANVDRSRERIQSRDNAFQGIDRGNMTRAASSRGGQSLGGMRLQRGR